jgi:hypothetical protein
VRTMKTELQGALLVDFTSTKFGDDFIKLIRNQKPQAIVVIDKSAGGSVSGPVVVRDHINLTGHSPLCGPNDPCGERFPVVQGIYVEDALPELPRVVAAGLVHGVLPSAEDLKLIKDLGAEVTCYNLVQAMLIAAHANCQVLAIVVPDSLSPELAAQVKELVGDKQ